MKNILFRAPSLTQSGYGVHARQIAQWLLSEERKGGFKLHCQVLPWGDVPWIVDSKRCDGLIGEIMKRTTQPQSDKKYDCAIQLQLPNEWSTALSTYNVGVTAGVETNKCNPEWVTACNKMQMLVVPSKHTLQSFTNTGNVVTKTKIVPESFPNCFLENKTVDLDLKLDTKFNFLVFGQLTGNNPENDRKNIFYTVKWLCETFKDNPDVGIIVKSNCGKNTQFDRNVMKNTFQTLTREVRSGLFPKVYLMHGDLTDVEVYSLLKHEDVKCLVSLTRGEGFGLPILEAAAAGLPVVATNWSAHTEFLGLGKYVDIDSRLTEIHQSRVDGQIFMPGVKWASPSEETFKRKVKKLYMNYDAPKRWATELQVKILEQYSQESIQKQYMEAFKGVL